jgi:hypothetical protein
MIDPYRMVISLSTAAASRNAKRSAPRGQVQVSPASVVAELNAVVGFALKRPTTMTPSSSPSAGRWSISTVPTCVYPCSMCCTFARVHGWAQGDSLEAPAVRSGAFGDELQALGLGAIRARWTVSAAAQAAPTFPTRRANRQTSPLQHPRLPGGRGFAIFLALSQSSKCGGSVAVSWHPASA